MASAFNLTAQLNLRGPSNIATIVADIRRQIGSINANVNFRLDPNAARNVAQLNTALTTFNRTLTQTSASAGNAAAALRNLSSAINNVRAQNLSQTLGGVNNAAAKASQTVANTGRAISTASSEMVEFGKQSGLAIRRFAAFSTVTGVVYGVVNAINQGINSYIEYDKQLVKLQQVTGQSAKGLQSLEQAITSLSTSYGVGSMELTEISSTLAQAGLSAKDTEKALKALALSSLAPSFDSMNETVEGSIALMRQFGIDAGDLEKALGSVNSVAARFAVEAADLITAIQRTGGVFATASKGVSEGTDALNEFLAVFTSIRATTRESAETIATGLRTIFTRIQREDTINALKEYGVNLQDLDGKFVGAYKAVELLSKGLSTLDPRDVRFSRIVEELGGFRQIGKVIPLIQQFSTAQDALKVAQTGQGSLAMDAAKAQESLAVQISKVRQEFLALFREIGKTDSFQTIVKGALSVASALIKVADSVKGFLPVLGVMLAFRGASAITQFGSGFLQGVRNTGGSRGPGGGRGARDGGPIRGYSKGDMVNMVDVALMPGETVVYPDAVNRAGVSRLRQLNYADKNGIAAKRTGGSVAKFSGGGYAQVPGTGRTDSFYTQLPEGSFVIRTDATSALGGPDGVKRAAEYSIGGDVQRFSNGSWREVSAQIRGGRGRPSKNTTTVGEAVDKIQSKTYDNRKGRFKSDFPFIIRGLNRSGTKAAINEEAILDKYLKKGVDDLSQAIVSQTQNNITVPSGDTPIQNKESIYGGLFETALLKISKKSSDKKDNNQNFDFPKGIGKTLSGIFSGMPPDISTDVKRTAAANAAMKSNIANKIANDMATGSKPKVVAPVGVVSLSPMDSAIVSKIPGTEVNSLLNKKLQQKGATTRSKNRKARQREDSYYDDALENAIWSNYADGGTIQKFAKGDKVGSKKKVVINRGVIDADDLMNAKNAPIVRAEMEKLGISNVHEYKIYLDNLAASRNEGKKNLSKFPRGQDYRLVQMLGAKASGKSTQSGLASGGTKGSMRETNVFSILTPADVQRADHVISTTSVEGPNQLQVIKNMNRAHVLSSRHKDSQQVILDNEKYRDNNSSLTLFGRKPGATKGASPDSGYAEAYLAAHADSDRVTTRKVIGRGKYTRIDQPTVRSPERTMVYMGNFGPSTSGHVQAAEFGSRKTGISPQDSVIVVSGDASIDFRNPNDQQTRTAIFPQQSKTGPSRLGMAQATFGARGFNVAATPKGTAPGAIPNVFKIGEDYYIVPRGKNDVAVVGDEKDDKVLKKYKDSGYSVETTPRIGGISGTAARDAIMKNDVASMKKLLSPEGFQYIQQHLDTLQKRPQLLDSILARFLKNSKSGRGMAGRLSSVTGQLSALPARKTKTTPPEIVAQMEGLRKQRDELTSKIGRRPSAILRRLEGMSRRSLGGLIQRFDDGGIAEELKTMGRSGLIGLARQRGIPYDYSILDPRAKLSAVDQSRKQAFLQALTEAGVLQAAKADDISRKAQSRSVAVVGITGDKSSTEIVTPGAKDKDTQASVRGVPVTLETGGLPPGVARRVQALIRNRVERLVADVGRELSKAAKLPKTKRSRSEIRTIASKDIEDIAGSIFEKGLGVANSQYDPKAQSIDFPQGLRPELASLMGVSSGVMTDVTNAATKDTAKRKVREGQFDRGRLEARARFGRSQFAVGGIVQRFAVGGTGKPSRKVPYEEVGKSPFETAKSSINYYSLEAVGLQSGLSKGEFDVLVREFKTSYAGDLNSFRAFIIKRAQQKKQKSGLSTDSKALQQFLLQGTTRPRTTPDQERLAKILMGEPDAGYRPLPRYADGGTIPALVSNGEAFVPPDTARKIGYSTLHRMNRADTNGMGKFGDGGDISVFKGPGTGTSDSIGPVELPIGSFILREKATKALGFHTGGSVGIQSFAGGGSLRPESIINRSTVLADNNSVAALNSLSEALKAMGINASKSAELVKSGSNISYKAVEKALVEDIKRLKLAGASTTQITQAEQILSTVRSQGANTIRTQQNLERTFGSRASGSRQILGGLLTVGAVGNNSGAAQETIRRQADMLATSRISSYRARYGNISAEREESIRNNSYLRATSSVTGVSERSLRRQRISGSDIEQYIRQSTMDRKTLAQMDKQYVMIRRAELQAAGTSASEAKRLIEQELRDRRAAANTMARENGMRGPGGRGVMGSIRYGIGDFSRGVAQSANYFHSGFLGLETSDSGQTKYVGTKSRGLMGYAGGALGRASSLAGTIAGPNSFMASMAIGMLAGQGENYANMRGGDKRTRAGRAAGFESATGTFAAGLALTGQAAMMAGPFAPIVAGVGLAATALASWNSGLEASKKALKDFDETLKAQKAEEANEALGKAFEALSKDVNNLDLKNKLNSKLKDALITNNDTSSRVFDEKKEEIKAKQIGSMGNIEYIGSLVPWWLGGASGQDNLRTRELSSKDLNPSDYIELARKQIARYEPAKQVAVSQTEAAMRQGATVDQIQTDKIFAPLRESIARASNFETLGKLIELDQRQKEEEIAASKAVTQSEKDRAAANLAGIARQKQFIINESFRQSQLAQTTQKTIDFNNAVEASGKAIRQLTLTFGVISRAFTQALNAITFKLNDLEASFNNVSNALAGRAEIGQVRSKDANVLANPLAFDEKQRQDSSRRVARGMFNPDAGNITPAERQRRAERASNVESILNADITGIANRTATAGTTRTDKEKEDFGGTAAVMKAELERQIQNLPQQMQEQLRKQFTEIEEDVNKKAKEDPELRDPIKKSEAFIQRIQDELGSASSSVAEEIKQAGIKYAEGVANTLNNFISLTNKAVQSQLKALEFRNKASDIRTDTRISLREQLSGGSIGVAERSGIFANRIGRMTGGVTDPTAIRQNIEKKTAELERQDGELKTKLESAKNDQERAQIAETAGRSMALLTLEINNNRQALEELANSTELATAAMNNLQGLQKLQAERLQNVDQVLTSTPQELRKLNESLVRVQQRAMGINPNPSRDAYRAYNRALRQSGGNVRYAQRAAQEQMAQDRATDLTTMQRYSGQYELMLRNSINPATGKRYTDEEAKQQINVGSANVRGQMAFESGAAQMYGAPLLHAIMAGADPMVDSAVRDAVGDVQKFGNMQARANEEKAVLEEVTAKKALITATSSLVVGFQQLSDVVNRILDNLTPQGQAAVGIQAVRNGKPVPAQARAMGGTIYASVGGNMVDFTPKGTDTVPAMLTPGEFVVNARATAQHLPLLQAINRGSDVVNNTPKFSKGGVIYAAGGGPISRREFDLVDTSRSGFLESGEIDQDLLKALDTNKDGKVSLTEFLGLIPNAITRDKNGTFQETFDFNRPMNSRFAAPIRASKVSYAAYQTEREFKYSEKYKPTSETSEKTREFKYPIKNSSQTIDTETKPSLVPGDPRTSYSSLEDFYRMDVDGDGVLSGRELTAHRELDTDRDKKVTPEEWEGRGFDPYDAANQRFYNADYTANSIARARALESSMGNYENSVANNEPIVNSDGRVVFDGKPETLAEKRKELATLQATLGYRDTNKALISRQKRTDEGVNARLSDKSWVVGRAYQDIVDDRSIFEAERMAVRSKNPDATEDEIFDMTAQTLRSQGVYGEEKDSKWWRSIGVTNTAWAYDESGTLEYIRDNADLSSRDDPYGSQAIEYIDAYRASQSARAQSDRVARGLGEDPTKPEVAVIGTQGPVRTLNRLIDAQEVGRADTYLKREEDAKVAEQERQKARDRQVALDARDKELGIDTSDIRREMYGDSYQPGMGRRVTVEEQKQQRREKVIGARFSFTDETGEFSTTGTIDSVDFDKRTVRIAKIDPKTGEPAKRADGKPGQAYTVVPLDKLSDKSRDKVRVHTLGKEADKARNGEDFTIADVSGQHYTTGQIYSVDDMSQTVVIQKANGKKVTVPLEKLAPESRSIALEQARNMSTASTRQMMKESSDKMSDSIFASLPDPVIYDESADLAARGEASASKMMTDLAAEQARMESSEMPEVPEMPKESGSPRDVARDAFFDQLARQQEQQDRLITQTDTRTGRVIKIDPRSGNVVEDSMSPYNKDLGDPGMMQAFGLGAAKGVGPGAVGLSVGTYTTAATAPLLGPFAPVAGLVVGGAAAVFTGIAQEFALNNISPEVAAANAEANAIMDEYPIASALGSAAPTMGYGLHTQGLRSLAGTITQRAVSGGISVAAGTATEVGANYVMGQETNYNSLARNAAINFVTGAIQPGAQPKTPKPKGKPIGQRVRDFDQRLEQKWDDFWYPTAEAKADRSARAKVAQERSEAFDEKMSQGILDFLSPLSAPFGFDSQSPLLRGADAEFRSKATTAQVLDGISSADGLSMDQIKARLVESGIDPQTAEAAAGRKASDMSMETSQQQGDFRQTVIRRQAELKARLDAQHGKDKAAKVKQLREELSQEAQFDLKQRLEGMDESGTATKITDPAERQATRQAVQEEYDAKLRAEVARIETDFRTSRDAQLADIETKTRAEMFPSTAKPAETSGIGPQTSLFQDFVTLITGPRTSKQAADSKTKATVSDSPYATTTDAFGPEPAKSPVTKAKTEAAATDAEMRGVYDEQAASEPAKAKPKKKTKKGKSKPASKAAETYEATYGSLDSAPASRQAEAEFAARESESNSAKPTKTKTSTDSDSESMATTDESVITTKNFAAINRTKEDFAQRRASKTSDPLSQGITGWKFRLYPKDQKSQAIIEAFIKRNTDALDSAKWQDDKWTLYVGDRKTLESLTQLAKTELLDTGIVRPDVEAPDRSFNGFGARFDTRPMLGDSATTQIAEEITKVKTSRGLKTQTDQNIIQAQTGPEGSVGGIPTTARAQQLLRTRRSLSDIEANKENAIKLDAQIQRELDITDQALSSMFPDMYGDSLNRPTEAQARTIESRPASVEEIIRAEDDAVRGTMFEVPPERALVESDTTGGNVRASSPEAVAEGARVRQKMADKKRPAISANEKALREKLEKSYKAAKSVGDTKKAQEIKDTALAQIKKLRQEEAAQADTKTAIKIIGGTVLGAPLTIGAGIMLGEALTSFSTKPKSLQQASTLEEVYDILKKDDRQFNGFGAVDIIQKLQEIAPDQYREGGDSYISAQELASMPTYNEVFLEKLRENKEKQSRREESKPELWGAGVPMGPAAPTPTVNKEKAAAEKKIKEATEEKKKKEKKPPKKPASAPAATPPITPVAKSLGGIIYASSGALVPSGKDISDISMIENNEKFFTNYSDKLPINNINPKLETSTYSSKIYGSSSQQSQKLPDVTSRSESTTKPSPYSSKNEKDVKGIEFSENLIAKVNNAYSDTKGSFASGIDKLLSTIGDGTTQSDISSSAKSLTSIIKETNKQNSLIDIISKDLSEKQSQPKPPATPAIKPPQKYATGGVVYANNGVLVSAQAMGTDTVPAMLTPGEFVINRDATQKHLPILQAINQGYYNQGGMVQYLANGGSVAAPMAPQYLAAGGMASQSYGGSSTKKEKYELDAEGMKSAVESFGQKVAQLQSAIAEMPNQFDHNHNHNIEANVIANGTMKQLPAEGSDWKIEQASRHAASSVVSESFRNQAKIEEQNPGDVGRILRG